MIRASMNAAGDFTITGLDLVTAQELAMLLMRREVREILPEFEELADALTGVVPAPDDEDDPKDHEPGVWLDLSALSGDATPVLLEAFQADNEEVPLEPEELEALRGLEVGGVAMLAIGGGAVEVRRRTGARGAVVRPNYRLTPAMRALLEEAASSRGTVSLHGTDDRHGDAYELACQGLFEERRGRGGWSTFTLTARGWPVARVTGAA